jgi:hypothetical protein
MDFSELTKRLVDLKRAIVGYDKLNVIGPISFDTI